MPTRWKGLHRLEIATKATWFLENKSVCQLQLSRRPCVAHGKPGIDDAPEVTGSHRPFTDGDYIQWLSKVWMVHQVERIRANLEGVALMECCVLFQRKVHIVKSWTKGGVDRSCRCYRASRR